MQCGLPESSCEGVALIAQGSPSSRSKDLTGRGYGGYGAQSRCKAEDLAS